MAGRGDAVRAALGRRRPRPEAPGDRRLSLVIPAFREEARIAGTVERVRAELGHAVGDGQLEIVVVDDGSGDATAERARAAGADVVVVQPENRGKGAAVRARMLAASGRTRAFTDADLAYAPAQVVRLLDAVEGGWDVVVREVDQESLDKGIGKIEKQLGKAVDRGKLEQSDADAIRGRITGTLDFADFADCDLVIEAITENLDQKLEMWRELDSIVKPEATFATNTSSLSVADQAAATGRPERFLGLHFFNPAQVMPLLEVVRADETGDEAVELGFALGEKLGKTTVAAGDNRGFIVNRLLIPYMFDAMRAREAGVGSTADIDKGMIAGASHPMGPLTLADFVGLDTLQSIGAVMHEYYGEERFAAPDTLNQLVAAGHLGRKSGRGFYDYSGDKPVAVDPGD